MRKWIANKKLSLLLKWAKQFGLTVCKIHVIAGTEYLVDSHGAYRKLATRRGR